MKYGGWAVLTGWIALLIALSILLAAGGPDYSAPAPAPVTSPDCVILDQCRHD